jgi:DNA-binding NarL/FixJ family response regulator
MITRRVFVIWAHPLFLEVLRRILSDPALEWAGASSDYGAASREVAELKPDTVVIEEREGDNTTREILEILESADSIVRVIRLSLNENQLSVYQREQRTVGRAEELLHLVLARSSEEKEA